MADRYYWATDIFTMFRDTGAAWEVVGAQAYYEYITTTFFHHQSFNTASANILYYSPLEIERTVTIDGIGITIGNPGAGNVYVAIYDAGPLNRLAVSVSTALAGVNQKQIIAIVPATLQMVPGSYHVAFINDSVDAFDTTRSVYGSPAGPPGPRWYLENLGGYMQPPAVAAPANPDIFRLFNMYVQVSSIP